MQERSGGHSVLGRSLTIGLDLVRGRRRYRYAGLGGRGDHQIRSGPSWRGALVGALVVVAVGLSWGERGGGKEWRYWCDWSSNVCSSDLVSICRTGRAR